MPPPPVAQLIGFTLTDVEPGRAVVTFAAGPQHASPMGTRHGGVLCDIADAAMGMAYAATLEAGETFTTRLVARASSTCMILRGEQAEGR